MSRALTLVAILAIAVVGLALPATPQAGREPHDVRVFARIPSPGMPEGIAVDRDGTVYVGTQNYGRGDADAPSKIFAFARDGTLRREYVVQGQAADEDHGVVGMALDGDGLLYVLDRNPARAFTLNPRTGEQQTYATFADVPPCIPVIGTAECSAGVLDLAPFPNSAAFAPDGTIYVTDHEQGLLWRVPRGGGAATVWFTDPRLDGVFGPNGIQFLDQGRTLLFAQTASQPPGTTDAAYGALYTLTLEADGSPGRLRQLWKGETLDAADGLAVADSGNIYLALAGVNQVVVLSPTGEERARIPATPEDNMRQEVPFDNPASVAFLGQRLLVTNQSVINQDPANWVVLDIFADERGLPLHRPRMRD